MHPLAHRPAADVVDDLADGAAHRHLHQTGVPDLADQAEDLRAGVVLGSDLGEFLRPAAEDDGDVGPGLDVVDDGGPAVDAFLDGIRRALPRLTHLALDGANQGRFLPADERPRASDDPDVEAKTAAQDVLAQKAVLAGLLQCHRQVTDRQGILRPHVHDAFRGGGSVGAHEHPLDDAVRVALQDAAVHVRPGVSLVGVAHNVLAPAARLSGQQLPFQAGGESPAPAAAQARSLHLPHHPFGVGPGQHLLQRLVSSLGDIVVDAGRVDLLAGTQDGALLMSEEGDLLPPVVGLARVRVTVQQVFGIAAGKGRLHDLGNVSRPHLRVERLLGQCEDKGPHLAEPVAAGGLKRNPALKAVLDDVSFEGLDDLAGAACPAGRPGADGDAQPAFVRVGAKHASQLSQVLRTG